MTSMQPLSHGDPRTASTANDSAQESGIAELPNRYSIRATGEKRELVCGESPTMSVRIERGLTVPAWASRKAPPGTIYLDGAAEGGPFLDAEKTIFNLDHHEGCVRSFTLATCEQAMVLIRKGLDFQTKDWTIFANDPDLDTVLAIWLLLNHMRLNDDPEIRRKIMPLVRLQGTIDAHGLEMQELCGFPPEMKELLFADLEKLRRREVTLKKEKKWQEVDFLEYTADILRAIDAMIYSSHHFEGVLEVEELARAEVGENQLAIVCRSEMGIYEVEPHLRRLHGKRLGVIVLQTGHNSYTVRQVDAFLPGTLQSAYRRLNLIDPAVSNRHTGNRWGGSAEIGGSPRASGTSLTPQQIAAAVARAYRSPSLGQRVRAMLITVAGTTGVMLGAMMATYAAGRLHESAGSMERYFHSQAGTYVGVLAVLSGILILPALRRGPKLFGMCKPVGFGWLAFLPLVLVTGLMGGAWIFDTSLGWPYVLSTYDWSKLAIMLGFPLVAEVLFRGLAHGTLAERFRTQHSGGPWFVSWPVIISSLLYALWSLPHFNPFFSAGMALTFGAALLFGISSGMARERSESLLPCLILHWTCLLAYVAVSSIFDLAGILEKISRSIGL
jgi:hypothetical protein